MRAVHINWTKPKKPDGGYYAEDFELFTTALSALEWRRHNGEIAMITDTAGYEFYKKRGLLSLWNEVKTTLDIMPGIDTDMFWAAGKLWALKKEITPVAMIDTDFIVWKPIAFDKICDTAVIHREELYADVYPGKEYFKMRNGYIFDCEWDWSEPAANTAFCVIKNQKFLEYYTDEAFKFMKNALPGGDNLTYMVFAEQRLFSMCAKKLGAEVRAFSDLERLFRDGAGHFTHTWGMKQQMRDMPELRYDFCVRCRARIESEFPEYAKILRGVPETEEYFRL